MNVDTFDSNPSIKWWFIVAVAMMLLTLFLWWAIKHCLRSRRQDPHTRGIYEHMYHDLAIQYPQL